MPAQPRNLASHNVSISVSIPIRLLLKIHDRIDRANQNTDARIVTVSSIVRQYIEEGLGE
jgi:hypothetical protein